MWKKCGILPGELARQEPYILFSLFEEDEDVELPEEMSPHLRMFYGL